MLAPGEYQYEIRRSGELLAIEEDRFFDREISGARRSAIGSDSFEATATLDEAGMIVRVTAHYRRGPFSRSAVYEADNDFIRGTVSSGTGGRTVETAKLGRYREVDAGLVLFKALMIAHLVARGQTGWTSRVASIDPSTLVAQTHKKTLRKKDAGGRIFLYEPRMGDCEEMEIDALGRIIRIADNTGNRSVLNTNAAG